MQWRQRHCFERRRRRWYSNSFWKPLRRPGRRCRWNHDWHRRYRRFSFRFSSGAWRSRRCRCFWFRRSRRRLCGFGGLRNRLSNASDARCRLHGISIELRSNNRRQRRRRRRWRWWHLWWRWRWRSRTNLHRGTGHRSGRLRIDSGSRRQWRCRSHGWHRWWRWWRWWHYCFEARRSYLPQRWQRLDEARYIRRHRPQWWRWWRSVWSFWLSWLCLCLVAFRNGSSTRRNLRRPQRALASNLVRNDVTRRLRLAVQSPPGSLS
jgi:hypothetical protein